MVSMIRFCVWPYNILDILYVKPLCTEDETLYIDNEGLLDMGVVRNQQ